VQLNTTPVSLVNPDLSAENPASLVRDFHADGDAALLKIDGGVNVNNSPGVDHVTPGSVVYGFEEFTDVRSPGYVFSGGTNVGTGFGAYSQSIDATQLAEGRHYITVRAFRHRNAATGGDGGPAVFTDFKKTIYVDRLRPEAEVVSFEPFASNPGATQNRDLIVRSVDGTANNVHVFVDLPVNVTEAQILQMAQSGQGGAGYYDRDSFIRGFFNVITGNHVATIVTFEPTGNHNIQRLPGLFTQTSLGAGFGDMNGNGVLQSSEIMSLSPLAFNHLLYSQGNSFNAAADVDGDGVITNLDLFELGEELVAGGASAAVMSTYDQLLISRGDLNGDNLTNAADVQSLYSSFGAYSWLKDLNVDGMVTQADVDTFVIKILRTSYADFDVNRVVDGADFLTWQQNLSVGSRLDQGDATGDGAVDADDLAVWKNAFGTTAPVTATPGAATVPESSGLAVACMAALAYIKRSSIFHRLKAAGSADGRHSICLSVALRSTGQAGDFMVNQR
jgi:alpha-amylase